jgi:hypothetical protein
MNHLLSLCLGATLCVSTASAATPSPQEDTASSTSAAVPVAFIYVSSSPNGGANQIDGFAAASNGTLKPIPGTPFREDVASLAVNGRYLFAATRNGISIDSFSIEPDGALLWLASKNTLAGNPGDCGDTGQIFLDHSGASLYDVQLRNDCSNNTYKSFAVEKPSGELRTLGTSGEDAWLYSAASFLGNNLHAYSAGCVQNLYWEVNGYKRGSSGLLQNIPIKVGLPAPKAGDFWCPALTSADPANHVAITLQAVDQQSFNPDGAPRLVSFSADAAGNLTTTNTLATMPASEVGVIRDIDMAPGGKLLAVGGSAGLQVFHFNGSAPLTRDSGRLTTAPIDQFFWDNDNHLYAISKAANKLFVFRVTPTGVAAVAGSPYTVEHPQAIIVQPRTAFQ